MVNTYTTINRSLNTKNILIESLSTKVSRIIAIEFVIITQKRVVESSH